MTLIIFDLETTGLDKEKHAIIQIAAIAVDDQYNEIDSFEVKIRFRIEDAIARAVVIGPMGKYIKKPHGSFWPELAEMFNDGEKVGELDGYTKNRFVDGYKEDWSPMAVNPHDARDMFTNFIKKHATLPVISKNGRLYHIAAMAGHNSQNFDRPFLQSWYKRLGGNDWCPASFTTIDTQVMAFERQVLDGIKYPNLKLETLAQFHGIAAKQSHDALDDVRMTAALIPCLRAMVTYNDEPALNEADEKIQAIMAGLPAELQGAIQDAN